MFMVLMKTADFLTEPQFFDDQNYVYMKTVILSFVNPCSNEVSGK